MDLQRLYNVTDWIWIYRIISIIYILCLLIGFFRKNKILINRTSQLYVLLVLLLIAYRPIGESGFADTAMYIEFFEKSKMENIIYPTKDIGYGFLNYLCSKLFSVRAYFVFLSFLGGGIAYFIFDKMDKKNRWLFLGLYYVGIFTFIFHAVIIRQNLAFLVFMLALVQDKKYYKISFLILSLLFHKSMIIPFFAYIVVQYYRNINFYLSMWIFFIVFSLVFNTDIINFIENIELESWDKRIRYIYEKDINSGYYSEKKIPWKTIVGTFIMILYGYYFEKMIKDSFYTKQLSLFILANIIWVVFMQTNFHYRIAYLSLFLYPLLILYPLKFIDSIYRNLVRK